MVTIFIHEIIRTPAAKCSIGLGVSRIACICLKLHGSGCHRTGGEPLEVLDLVEVQSETARLSYQNLQHPGTTLQSARHQKRAVSLPAMCCPAQSSPLGWREPPRPQDGTSPGRCMACRGLRTRCRAILAGLADLSPGNEPKWSRCPRCPCRRMACFVPSAPGVSREVSTMDWPEAPESARFAIVSASRLKPEGYQSSQSRLAPRADQWRIGGVFAAGCTNWPTRPWDYCGCSSIRP